jgi:hypothetical protein
LQEANGKLEDTKRHVFALLDHLRINASVLEYEPRRVLTIMENMREDLDILDPSTEDRELIKTFTAKIAAVETLAKCLNQ